MKVKLLLWLSVVSLLTTSCSYDFYCKRCPLEPTVIHTVETVDSVVIVETLKDTVITVYLPADSLITIHKVICDSLGYAQMAQTVMKHKNMIVTLEIEKGILKHNVTHLLDSLEVTILYKEKEVNTLKKKLEKLEQHTVTKEKYIPKFVKILAWIGGVVVGLVFLLLLYNLTGIIKNPFRWVKNLM